MIYSCEITQQRLLVYVVPRDETAVFRNGEAVISAKRRHLKWKEARALFPEAQLPMLELASGQSPPLKAEWTTEVISLGNSRVTVYGGLARARETSIIIGYEAATIKLYDQAVGFAFSGTRLFAYADAFAIGVQGSVFCQEAAGANCFIGPEAHIQPGWPHHSFDGTAAGLEKEWRIALPRHMLPQWPG